MKTKLSAFLNFRIFTYLKILCYLVTREYLFPFVHKHSITRDNLIYSNRCDRMYEMKFWHFFLKKFIIPPIFKELVSRNKN